MQVACHVCGTQNTRRYWAEEVGVVEDYYFCEACGYFEEMAYSPYHDGIMLKRTPIALLKQIGLLFKNRKRLRGLRFDTCHF